MREYDFVIIGSGIGGLMSACILAKEGYSVCVLERHVKPGGCLQTFARGSSIFDVGVHYIGGLHEGQVLRRIFEYLGIMKYLEVKYLDQDCFDKICFSGDSMEFRYPVGMENYAGRLVSMFPEERDSIRKYITKLNEVADSVDLYNLRETDGIGFNPDYIGVSASAYIESLTSDRRLQLALGGMNSLYGGLRDKSHLYMHSLVSKHFIDGPCRLIGGGGQLVSAFVSEIKNSGGEVFLNTSCSGLHSDENGISEAVTSDGRSFRGKNYISNLHPAVTLAMTDSGFIRRVYRDRINSLPNTTSVFTVYAELNSDSFEYLNYNYYCSLQDDIWTAASAETENWPAGFMMLTPPSSISQSHADTAILMTYMSFSDVKKWESTVSGNRGEDYLDFKRRKSAILIEKAEKSFPGFKSKIKKYYTSSPLTYRDYTGTPNGSMYGVIRDHSSPLNSFIHPKTRIPNLYLAGQNNNLHGILGVTLTALMLCGDIMGINNLIRKINNA